MLCLLCPQEIPAGSRHCQACERLPHYEKLFLTRLLAMEGQLDALNTTLARALALMELEAEHDRRRYANATRKPRPDAAEDGRGTGRQ